VTHPFPHKTFVCNIFLYFSFYPTPFFPFSLYFFLLLFKQANMAERAEKQLEKLMNEFEKKEYAVKDDATTVTIHVERDPDQYRNVV
jgi:hypothetical protein